MPGPMETPISAIHVWDRAVVPDETPLILTGHLNQEVHAWTVEGEHVWTHETELTEEVRSTGKTHWFPRSRPGVHDERRYSQFRPVSDSVHFFLTGWFREFGDADLTSLIFARGLQLQVGLPANVDRRPNNRRKF